MKVTQICTLINSAIGEELGETALVKEDLSNVADVGQAIGNAMGYDKFTGKLVDRIGRVIFVERPYQGRLPKIIRDAWEYGSIACKISGELPLSQINEEWELTNGASIDPNVVTLPDISVKAFNKKVTFEIPLTIATDQVKSAFVSAEELNRFISFLFYLVGKAMDKYLDMISMRALNNAIAVTADANGANVIHLLTDYASDTGDATLTTAELALSSEAVLRYASSRILEKKKSMSELSVLFNQGNQARQTSEAYLHFALHAKFASRCKTYLKSTTFHDELVSLDGYEEVCKWQGFGTSDAWTDTSAINVTARLADGTTKDISKDDIVGFMFDRDAVAVMQPKEKVTSQYNGKGDFTNYWYKYTGEYINDFNENMCLFLLD